MPTVRAGSMKIDCSTAVARWRIVTGFLSIRLPLLISLTILACLLVMYAAQTGLGHWQVDEFQYFTDHRANGWNAYFKRFYVSPRPLSELFIYVYGTAVLAFNRDLVPEALMVLWGGSLLGIVAAAWATLGRPPARLLAATTLGIAPMIFVMQISPVTEMFYWPVATVAYVPTVAAITALLFLLGEEPSPARRRWCCTALLVSALSHEIGAALAIGFAVVAGLFALIDVRAQRRAIATRDVVTALWWLIPAVAGVLVMLGLVLFRSAHVDLGADTKPYTGRLLASAGMAAWQVLVDITATGNSTHDVLGSVAAVLQKSVFAIGFALIWLRWGRVRPGRWHIALAFGLLVAVFFSILAAYYHYGDLCCERHETARQWLVEIAFILTSTAILARWPAWHIPTPRTSVRTPTRPSDWWGPVFLIASLLPVVAQIPEIREDFRVLTMAGKARARTWQSGRAAGPQMEFYMPPDNSTMLIHGTSIPVGTYELGSLGQNDLLTGVGAFFGKKIITTCQAWQSHQSFLIDGRFFPACPPHAGPPDLVFNTTSH